MRDLHLLRQVCSLPTAPFAEGQVLNFIEDFVRKRPRLSLRRDRFGNRLIELRPSGASSARRRLILAAHTDHPGLIAREMSADRRLLKADFHGGVRSDYAAGAKVLFFPVDGSQPVSGRICDIARSQPDRPDYPGKVIVRIARAVTSGSPGMFDLGEGRFMRNGRRFRSRAIDDLGGVAAALAAIDRLARRPPGSPVALLLTRAEEDGFVGAIAAAAGRGSGLIRKSDLLLSIECSAEQPYAPQGNGVIIRVGDRTSIFDSALTWFITDRAAALQKRRKSFGYQRALMPGGTCEATVYDLYGYTSAAVCIPLGNYHNMNRRRRKLAAEYIDVEDWRCMVELFVEVARSAHEFSPANPGLRQRIDARFKKLEPLLRQTAATPR